jgi:hypothetical protein
MISCILVLTILGGVLLQDKFSLLLQLKLRAAKNKKV